MKRAKRRFGGTREAAVSSRERENRAIAREAAAEGIVLMKNEGALPLPSGSTIALFGSGAGQTVKGGTGSGDVNEREAVSIYQGLLRAGYHITSGEWIADYGERYRKSREAWRRQIQEETKGKPPEEFFQVYASHPYKMPSGRAVTAEDCRGAKTALYVISRIAGEGADRSEQRGDYALAEQEKADLAAVSRYCDQIVVLLNVGAPMELTEILEIPNVTAILYLAQPGMEGGTALADVISGRTTPSGRLTDTWAAHYSDYPNSEFFCRNSGDARKELYKEGIYVGYRYFDSFHKKPLYPFGYGLSYTSFSMDQVALRTDHNRVTVQVRVSNTGTRWAGKEVVQLYASCPQSGLPKEYRRLCGYGKTSLLQPGQKEALQITFPVRALASFDEQREAWIMEAGLYGIWIGNSSRNLELAGAFQVENDAILERVQSICPLTEPLEELVRPEEEALHWERQWQRQMKEKGLRPVPLQPMEEQPEGWPESQWDKEAARLTELLSEEELISMTVGEISREQEQALGAASVMVPGAAGETSSVLEKKYDVPGIAMADGPAGLRLLREYQRNPENGMMYGQGPLAALEGGLFAEQEKHPDAETYYQYCSALPVGTLLAQTWNTELLEQAGRAVAREMQEFGVAWWLAPGLNIHRNPLCGRNFEYYSEDPLISGTMAAAMTRGVQSLEGVGTTIKHFACNNRENDRLASDSVLSERTLREIYLRGFEIAVKTAQPMAMMTSYNKINGVHAANCRDLCTTAARQEWGFQGIIMTDWTTTMPAGGSSSWRCIHAGNDLIMPGWTGDYESIRSALREGALDRQELKDCVRRMLRVIFQTLGYEDCAPYGRQFEGLSPYVTTARSVC